MGSVSISASPIDDTTYRMSAALRRSASSASAVSAPTAAPCQTNCSSAQPTACAAGWRSHISIAGIVRLLLRACRVDGVPDVTQLLRRGALRRERLHHQLHRRAAERAVDEIADELPLGLFLAEPRSVDMGPIAIVALDQPLLGHDLKELQGGRVGRLPVPGEHLVDLAYRTRPALPENAQDGQLGIGRARDGGSGHGCSLYERLRR